MKTIIVSILIAAAAIGCRCQSLQLYFDAPATCEIGTEISIGIKTQADYLFSLHGFRMAVQYDTTSWVFVQSLPGEVNTNSIYNATNDCIKVISSENVGMLPENTALCYLHFKARSCQIMARDFAISATFPAETTYLDIQNQLKEDTLYCPPKSIYITGIKPNLGADTLICNDESIVLDVFCQNCIYQWSDGTTFQNLIVSDSGTYAITVTDPLGCINMDSLNVLEDFFEIVPLKDTSIHPNTAINIGFAEQPGLIYLWSNGATTSIINIARPDTYKVTITNKMGCSLEDGLTVSEIIPRKINAFSPNGDGINDVLAFEILELANGLIQNSRLVVWDNWGNTIYENSNYQNNWDGTSAGRPVPQDTYYFTLQYSTPIQTLRGTMSILR